MALHVAVDMDDVCVDFTAHIVKCVNREYGANLSVEQFTDWNFGPWLDPVLGRSWWEWLKGRDWLWTKAPAIPGAIGGLHQLREMGCYVELLTSKPEWAEWVVWAWLGKWRPNVHRVTIASSRSSHAGHLPKHEASDASVLVDDGWHNVEPWCRTGRTALIFDQPWNADRQTRRAFRVRNWAEVVDRIAQLREGVA